MIFSAKKGFFALFVIGAMIKPWQTILNAQEKTTDQYLKDFVASCGKPDLVKARGEKLALLYSVSNIAAIIPVVFGVPVIALGGVVLATADGDSEQALAGGGFIALGTMLSAVGMGLFIYNSTLQGKVYLMFDAKGLVVKDKRALQWSMVEEIKLVGRIVGRSIVMVVQYKDRFGKTLLELGAGWLPIDLDNIVAISKYYMKKTIAKI